MSSNYINILIIEPNKLLAHGLEHYLKKNSQYRINVQTDNTSPETLKNYIQFHRPDLIIANPIVCGLTFNRLLRSQTDETPIIAFVDAVIDKALLSGYATSIAPTDPIENILSIVDSYCSPSQKSSDKSGHTLTPREKEVVVGVALGLTNKEIAANLGLSTHTVITHRRNIAKKLSIHSPSGLTIYAIANNLVSMDQVNMQL